MRLFSAACAAVAAIMISGLVHAADCDPACFRDLVTRYIDAITAHDPARLAVAPGVRFTEDSQDLKLGEGLWKTATREGDFRQDYIDLNKQIAISHVQLFDED